MSEDNDLSVLYYIEADHLDQTFSKAY